MEANPPMEPVPSTSFVEQLTHLHEALTGADPLAIAPGDTASQINEGASSAFADSATAILASFSQATEPTRRAHVLHALDEAIVAIETAVLLAESLNCQGITDNLPEACLDSTNSTNPLNETYHAFRESQPAYQALYHYRNALATWLHADTRMLPAAVAEDREPSVAEEAPH